MDGYMERGMDGQMNEWVGGWTDWQVDEWICGWVDELIYG